MGHHNPSAGAEGGGGSQLVNRCTPRGSCREENPRPAPSGGAAQIQRHSLTCPSLPLRLTPPPPSERPTKWGCRRLARGAGADAPRRSGAALPRAAPSRHCKPPLGCPHGGRPSHPPHQTERQENEGDDGCAGARNPPSSAHPRREPTRGSLPLQAAVEEAVDSELPPMQSRRSALPAALPLLPGGARPNPLCESPAAQTAVGVALDAFCPRRGASLRAGCGTPRAGGSLVVVGLSQLPLKDIPDTWTLPTRDQHISQVFVPRKVESTGA